MLRVGGLLRRLLLADLPLPAVAGPDGRVLLRPWELDHEEYVDHGLDQLRQSASEQPQVLAALLRTIRMLEDHVTANGREDLVPVLDRHRHRLIAAIRHGPLPSGDRDDLLEIAESRTDPADHAPHIEGRRDFGPGYSGHVDP
ncbi:putative membrane protein [Nocardioides massiliensis]|uniref:Membrane protein n=1 Tax=Nocardioides massiliensis TaxID=1325935 RepID=A0ABT9NN92_9ACTN|nr:putative membrane protein [Nocardioides massiliensis]